MHTEGNSRLIECMQLARERTVAYTAFSVFWKYPIVLISYCINHWREFRPRGAGGLDSLSIGMPTRILIAEDSPAVRTALRSLLESEGSWEIIDVENGQDAIAKAQAMNLTPSFST